jgi:twitching motility protein PilT
MPHDIHKLLQFMVEKRASDLHLTVGSPPQFRIDGQLIPVKTEPLSNEEVTELLYSVLNEKQKKRFEETSELDLSFRWKGGVRCRANLFRQQGYVAGAIRQIPNAIPPMGDLGLPKIVESLLVKPNGLILVTGPTGSGKSTTLAAMIDFINDTKHLHIITIEDPVEFVHRHKMSIVNQREIGTDTESFSGALRYVLRQDPDVVLLGEVRDRESMEACLRISETGHLALATLHTNNAIQTIHRVLDFFPPEQQEMVRTQLSFVLKAIFSQQLLPRIGGGRAMALELLIPTPGIQAMIRDDKTHQIYSAMQMGQSRSNMQTLNQALYDLVSRNVVSMEVALAKSYQTEELEKMVQQGPQRPAVQRA